MGIRKQVIKFMKSKQKITKINEFKLQTHKKIGNVTKRKIEIR